MNLGPWLDLLLVMTLGSVTIIGLAFSFFSAYAAATNAMTDHIPWEGRMTIYIGRGVIAAGLGLCSILLGIFLMRLLLG